MKIMDMIIRLQMCNITPIHYFQQRVPQVSIKSPMMTDEYQSRTKKDYQSQFF